MNQETLTQLRAAGDRWREIYTTVNNRLADTDGSLFAFLVELVESDESDEPLGAKVQNALAYIDTLKKEAAHQNVTYRGGNFNQYIKNVASGASLMTLHMMAIHRGAA
jgi:hypothetical protein